MPASKSSSSANSRDSDGGKPSGTPNSARTRKPAEGARRRTTSTGKAARSSASRQATAARVRSRQRSAPAEVAARAGGGLADGLSTLAEQVASRIIKQLDLVMLTRERIQETLDEAAERGRVTRSDANELVSELVKRGRQQTDDLLSDIDKLLGRGREQLDSATRRARQAQPVERLARGAGRARRTVGVASSPPIPGYENLTASQVEKRLEGLTPAQLRKVRDYERRHANRKSVLAAVGRSLG